ncbi:hypothetical protein FRC07_010398, partial [Ceratobasidium sp. 392]
MGLIDKIKEILHINKNKKAAVATPPPARTPAFDATKVMVIYVLGGPGAAGELLREEQKREGSELGALISEHIRNGTLVSGDVTIKLLEDAIRAELDKPHQGAGWENEHGRFLVDGFPRKLDHALKFDENVCKATFVLFFDTTEEVMLAHSITGPREPISKRQRRIDTSAFEDIARELEEDTPPPSRGRSVAEGEDDDPDTWLLGQYGAEDEGEGDGAWTSEDGDVPRDGMDVDEVEELEAELLDTGGGGEKDKAREKTRPPAVAPAAGPVEEKAAYTSSGRLLVPSHKSREAKAAAGATAQVWEDLEAQGLKFAPAKKKGGSKSKSKPSAAKASGSNNASSSGTPQPRAGGAGASKSGPSKSKSLATAVNKSAAAGLALAALSKSKKKGDAMAKKSKDKEARSRSESRQVETPAPEAVLQAVAKVAIVEPQEEEEEDNRLYCICKTKYDEERSMIACDRCDDWYHPSCVSLPESDIDLIDQFVCPLCVPKYNVHTTYKTRCAVQDCTKPARAPVSKYCSHECGLKKAAAQLQTLRARGVNMDQLWYAAKDARAPEGVV